MSAQLDNRPGLFLFLSVLAAIGGLAFPVAAEEKPAPELLLLPTEVAETPSRVDALGDSLPPGAVMRLGSTRWRHGDVIQTVCYSQDGKRIASASFGDGSIRIWDAETGKMLHRFRLNEVVELALSEDGKRLAAIAKDPSGENQGIWVWEEGDQKSPHLLTKTGEALCLLFHVEQLWVGELNRIACWDFKREKQVVDYKFKEPTRVTALAFFRGTKPMIAAATNKGALVIDASGEKLAEDPIAKKESATTIAFAPDGKSVAVGTDDGALYVWSIKDKLLEKRLDFRPHRAGVTSVMFSPDGKQLISVCDAGEVYRWNAVTGDKVSKVVVKGAPPVAADAAFTPALVLSPDGKRLAGRFAPGKDKVDHRLHVWNTANGEDLSLTAAIEHSSPVWKMALQSDGSLVSLSESGELLHWTSKFGEVIRRDLLPRDGYHNRAALSRDGGFAYCSDNTGIEVANIRTRARSEDFSQDRQKVYASAFSPDSNLLATAYVRSIGLWSIKDKSVTEVYLSRIRRATTLAFSGDGKRLLLADEEVVLVWDVASRATICELKNVRSDGPIALSAHGQFAAIWSTKGELRFFNADNGEEFPTSNVKVKVAHDLAFVPDGHCVVVATDEGVRFFEPISGRELLGRLDGGQGAIKSLALKRDGTLLATGGADGTVLLWDVQRVLHNGMVAHDGQMPLLPEQRLIHWSDLASTDPATSYSASSAFFDGGKGSVTYFRDRLLTHEKPFSNAEQQRLLKQLANPDYKERAKAFNALKTLGRAAEPMLREAFRTEKDEIMHIRLRAFLSELELDGIITPKDDRVREMRVVQLLELMDTPQARELLNDLAQKGASEQLRKDAGEALQRLKALAPKE